MDKYLQERKNLIDMISRELKRLHENGYSLESVSTGSVKAFPEEGNNHPKDLVKIEFVFKEVRNEQRRIPMC